ncbi:MAG: SDR family oxidoreductase [Anaerolineales bacterium]|nr:SDR family oxidoreductase [Anaerolineales bacterium]
MQGKTVLVTGATAGIGEVTARELARQGAIVVGVGRNAEKCRTTAEQIRAATGNAQVSFIVADLSTQAGVRQVAEAFKRQHSRLDVLINNAGAYFANRQTSVDGLELTFALNHMAYFLLTDLLLDVLKASAPARIINVASAAHRSPIKLNFDDLQNERGYNGFPAYGQSKLANVLFTYELARRLAGTGITANTLHPGFVATNFGHNNGRVVSFFMKIIQRLSALQPEQGAATTLYLATSPAVEGVTGKYFDQSRAVASSPESYDEAAARRLWEASAALVRQPA